jgi:hypothetical protein
MSRQPTESSRPTTRQPDTCNATPIAGLPFHILRNLLMMRTAGVATTNTRVQTIRVARSSPLCGPSAVAAARHRGTHTVEGIASPSLSDPRGRRHPRRASKGRPRIRGSRPAARNSSSSAPHLRDGVQTGSRRSRWRSSQLVCRHASAPATAPGSCPSGTMTDSSAYRQRRTPRHPGLARFARRSPRLVSGA